MRRASARVMPEPNSAASRDWRKLLHLGGEIDGAASLPMADLLRDLAGDRCGHAFDFLPVKGRLHQPALVQPEVSVAQGQPVAHHRL